MGYFLIKMCFFFTTPWTASIVRSSNRISLNTLKKDVQKFARLAVYGMRLPRSVLLATTTTVRGCCDAAAYNKICTRAALSGKDAKTRQKDGISNIKVTRVCCVCIREFFVRVFRIYVKSRNCGAMRS